MLICPQVLCAETCWAHREINCIAQIQCCSLAIFAHLPRPVEMPGRVAVDFVNEANSCDGLLV